MVSFSLDWHRPVTRFAILWGVIGILSTGYGLYEMSTYSCEPTATTGCGDSFGFVFVLWGLPILGLVVTFLLVRLARQNLRDDQTP